MEARSTFHDGEAAIPQLQDSRSELGQWSTPMDIHGFQPKLLS
jgi:hypothetical protein